MGEAQENIRGQHDCTEAPTSIGAQQRDISITSYTLKIKELCDALGSIDVVIDDDEMVQICLGGIAP